MPGWLIAALITSAALLVAWWAETRATAIVVELKAIRANLKAIRTNLDNLGAIPANPDNPGTDNTDAEVDKGESSERVSELPRQSGSR